MYADKLDAVTKNLVAQMENGTVPWEKPWKSGRYRPFPFNASTGATYHGINVLLLWIAELASDHSSNGWMTFKQMRSLDASLIKLPDTEGEKTGQKSTVIVRADKYIPTRDFVVRANGDIFCRHTNESRTKKQAERFYYKAYNVFNLDQIKHLPPKLMPPDITDPVEGEYRMSEDLIYLLENFPVEVRHGESKAFFNVTKDFIGLPAAEDFKTFPDYLATRFHEMIHSTGHESRLNRIATDSATTKYNYAFEELIAEIGSAFLCAQFAIGGRLQHAAYLHSYISAIKEDSALIYKAAAGAQKAFDAIMAIIPAKNEVAA